MTLTSAGHDHDRRALIGLMRAPVAFRFTAYDGSAPARRTRRAPRPANRARAVLPATAPGDLGLAAPT